MPIRSHLMIDDVGQLVENEDMIGTLIETNDRIIAALETYDTLSKPNVSEKDVEDVQTHLAAVKISDSELGKLQEKQRAAVQRSIGRASGKAPARTADDEDGDRGGDGGYVHPDLQDLNFGSLGAGARYVHMSLSHCVCSSAFTEICLLRSLPLQRGPPVPTQTTAAVPYPTTATTSRRMRRRTTAVTVRRAQALRQAHTITHTRARTTMSTHEGTRNEGCWMTMTHLRTRSLTRRKMEMASVRLVSVNASWAGEIPRL